MLEAQRGKVSAPAAHSHMGRATREASASSAWMFLQRSRPSQALNPEAQNTESTTGPGPYKATSKQMLCELRAEPKRRWQNQVNQSPFGYLLVRQQLLASSEIEQRKIAGPRWTAAFTFSPILVHEYTFAADVGDLWRIACDVGWVPECQPLQSLQRLQTGCPGPWPSGTGFYVSTKRLCAFYVSH